MGKIFCVMGKSATGKDTIYRELLQAEALSLKKIIPYTTRPIREGEEHGREYFFCKEEDVTRLQENGKIIELRAYNTVHGIWKYFTVDDDQIDLGNHSYLLIGTLEAYRKIRDYYGASQVLPIYIEVEDGERLTRALNREKRQKEPKYAEMCRRFLADSEDFSEQNLADAQITRRFVNENLEDTIAEAIAYIQEMM